MSFGENYSLIDFDERVTLWLQPGPWQRTSLTPVFLSSTCFRPSGAAQQQSGFLNFTSGSVWKWRLQWRNSGSPIERSVAHGTLVDAPRYASAWKQRKRRLVRGVLHERSNAHSVRKYKNGCAQSYVGLEILQSLPLLLYSLLQRVRSLPCACAYVAPFARRLAYNHYAIAHAYNAANAHAQGSDPARWSQKVTLSSKAIGV